MDCSIKRLGRRVNQVLNNTDLPEELHEKVNMMVELLYLVEKFAGMETEEIVKNLLRAIINDLEQKKEQVIRNKLADLYEQILNSVLEKEIDGNMRNQIHNFKPNSFVKILNDSACRYINGTKILILNEYWDQFVSHLKMDNGDKALWEYVVKKINNLRGNDNIFTLNRSMGVVGCLYGRYSTSKMIYKLRNFISQKNELPDHKLEVQLYDKTIKGYIHKSVLNFDYPFITIGNHDHFDFVMNHISNKKIFMVLMVKDNNLIPVNLQTKTKLFVKLKKNNKYPLRKGDKFILIDRIQIQDTYTIKNIIFEVKSILFEKNLEIDLNSEIRIKTDSLNDEFSFISSNNKSKFIIGQGTGGFEVDHTVLGKIISKQHAFVEYNNGQWFLINNSKNGVWFAMRNQKELDIRSRECFLGSHKNFTVFTDSNNRPTKLLKINLIDP